MKSNAPFLSLFSRCCVRPLVSKKLPRGPDLLQVSAPSLMHAWIAANVSFLPSRHPSSFPFYCPWHSFRCCFTRNLMTVCEFRFTFDFSQATDLNVMYR